MRRRLRASAIGAALVFAAAMSGCAATASPSIAVDEDTVLVDVRTPAEFADGHLDGAVNIDLQSPDFEDTVSELNPEDEYVVYCASGNRSAQAVAAMKDVGLSVTDAGGIAAAERATRLLVIP
ncbi:rhodanese-like domain-containing protein [Microbacterium chocolatum]|uniref:rhodanese-like domain-containing protein n=1 Tax=Microbacterium aurantiacum TaxID=162393 RepID=UPI00338F67C5